MVLEISVSELRRKRVSELVEILTTKEFRLVREEKRYSPASGDGHSFRDSYDEEIIKHGVNEPINEWGVRRRAYNELKRIRRGTSNPNLVSQCNEGLNDEFRPTIPRAIGTGLQISAMIGFYIGIGYLGYKTLVEPFMK